MPTLVNGNTAFRVSNMAGMEQPQLKRHFSNCRSLGRVLMTTVEEDAFLHLVDGKKYRTR